MFIDSMDIPSMLGPGCSLGLLAVSGREKQPKPSICAGFFQAIFISLRYSPAFLTPAHFCIQILQDPFPASTFESSSMLR